MVFKSRPCNLGETVLLVYPRRQRAIRLAVYIHTVKLWMCMWQLEFSFWFNRMREPQCFSCCVYSCSRVFSTPLIDTAFIYMSCENAFYFQFLTGFRKISWGFRKQTRPGLILRDLERSDFQHFVKPFEPFRLSKNGKVHTGAPPDLFQRTLDSLWYDLHSNTIILCKRDARMHLVVSNEHYT